MDMLSSTAKQQPTEHPNPVISSLLLCPASLLGDEGKHERVHNSEMGVATDPTPSLFSKEM